MKKRILLLFVMLSAVGFSQTKISPQINTDSTVSALYAEGNYWKLMGIYHQRSLDSLSAQVTPHSANRSTRRNS
ncbi:MAG: hypothetical protein M0R68_04730 [Bacteroidetes bacterium]|nr:hypothetical protein [Bacteroidota bacterium]